MPPHSALVLPTAAAAAEHTIEDPKFWGCGKNKKPVVFGFTIIATAMDGWLLGLARFNASPCQRHRQCDQICQKFCHFGHSFQVFGKKLTVYFFFGKMLSPIWQICDIIRLIFIFANGQILNNDLTIWSHCRHGSTKISQLIFNIQEVAKSSWSVRTPHIKPKMAMPHYLQIMEYITLLTYSCRWGVYLERHLVMD